MKPVHTYMLMVQCPVCRYTFMQQGDACCWRCAPTEAPLTRDELAAARRIRETADAEVGAAGSLVGLGFAPLRPSLIVFGAPVSRPDRPASAPTSRFERRKIIGALAVVGWLCYVAYCLAQMAYRSGWLTR